MDAHTQTETGAPAIRSAGPPPSPTEFAWCLVALGLSLGLIWLVAPWHNYAPALSKLPYLPVIPCLGIALVFIALHVAGSLPGRRLEAPTASGAQLSRVGRTALRCCGVGATFSLIAFAYWLFPEYRGNFYDPFWSYLRTLAPLVFLIPFYLWWADRRFVADSDDEYLQFGLLVTQGWRAVSGDVVRHHLLSWTVKAFFLPLMTVYLSREMSAFYQAVQDAGHGTMHSYQILFHLSYLTDLLFAVVGYTLTMRLFDTHMRSVEPTVAGWVVALSCYSPFVSAIGHSYTAYDDRSYWDTLLQSWPLTQMGFGIIIVTLTFIYGLATASFGIRFSNLTHRGIITNGPYRFSKHPAYLAKNLSWWLISVPMFSQLGLAAAFRNCCLLALVNLIYYARARTEERHLSRDPVYVEYALWMNEHGLLAPLARWLPFMRYSRSPSHAAGSVAASTA